MFSRLIISGSRDGFILSILDPDMDPDEGGILSRPILSPDDVRRAVEDFLKQVRTGKAGRAEARRLASLDAIRDGWITADDVGP